MISYSGSCHRLSQLYDQGSHRGEASSDHEQNLRLYLFESFRAEGC